MKSSVIFGFVLSLILHTLVLMFFLFSFYTQEKSSGVDFKQGAEFTSIMMVSEFPIGELKEVSIDQKKSNSQDKNKKQDERISFNSQDKNAVLKVQKKIEKQDENQAQKEIANASENSKFKNESLSAPLQSNKDKTQTIVSGNAKEQVKSYQALLMAHLTKFKKYPQEAIMQKQEGVVRIRVSIDESGNVLSKELKKSCPYAALNDEALSLFKRASPLPKPPKEMLKNGDKISFVMPIDYNIKDYLGKK
ncbi:energy transducer TonB [Campylobacter jejuni]|uniref:TonB transport protein n=2 Tax=Campylobacter jejuni TaxID=197 RepID=Q0PBV8_CAMJE|nr:MULTISPECIES: energy transducer TonB [Campylobacter]YP_002343639.1 TonB transport protein [Campylobacter jejuni subsp. jejuni NCTC 11168 = ATCC 700819]APA80480.1 Ferric siderophore transport system, periplasmic binding protein TonB [Campylobacter jejuni subsp. jejuni D42a]EAI1479085.1 energy transducer TonB [Campylobacter coli]EAI3656194.1 energy transducer TonB [Campylobacter fetus]AGQ95742.1 biopolymer transporter TonB [Campylobacter jejuni 32488]AGV47081.1 energy transducer TonB [Campyl